MSQPFITDVEDHRMKTAVEPAEKRIQLAVFGPHRRHTIPSIQLLLKDLAADLGQMLKRLLLGFPLRQEVNRWLPSEVFQCQLRTRWIHSTWAAFNDGLAFLDVRSLALVRPGGEVLRSGRLGALGPGTLYAGTPGGVFKIQ